uniref:disease resistance protein RPV1-like n=1 Tax=Erigeron canadensis TaxID=72917 RepID=UPI001CB94308|nr:disease resistance protein RPV1-like [Erigeron canadensis]
MASTSSNTSPVSNNNVCRYDVFLSFRGETRNAFTDHLYKALVDVGLTPFRDNDDIDRGEDLKPEIERGIRESRASIVVLSKNYATSRWCLDELSLILEQATKLRHFVLPIFYHVYPSHDKNQEESFQINVIPDDTKWTEDNVERWKAALTKVSNMHGEVLNGSETKFLENIVGIIEKKLDLKKVYLKANLVGMDTWHKEVDYWFERSRAQILAVWGMGGIGKTTLARHIVYSNWENFGSISILEDIGSRSIEQLLELQKKLLGDIFQGKKKKIPSVWQGTRKIENALQTEKALIVLDNIVEPSHLFELLGTGIETQCKIIITTKQSNPHKWFDQLTSWRCQELEMKSLDKNNSLELLRHHAFGSKVPEGYDHLVDKALSYCGGNPLALEVLGASLSRKNKQFWDSRLTSFEKELHARILDVLIGSYESLPLHSHRSLFLHIACFFVGKDRDYVEKILEPDYSALSGIETLFESCLLSVSPNKKLMMHRMLQEMARTIVYKESPENPAKRSRVWKDEDSYDILKKGKGSRKIEGLALDMNLLNQGIEQHAYKSSDLTTESFKKMEKLKLLQLSWVGLTGPYENISQQLRWLCWIGFGLRAIPSNLCMENLVAIDMSYSCLEEFEPPGELPSLKILNLRSSKDLREIRNIYRLRFLEILILWDCRSLTHVTLGGLTRLAILNLTGCEKLCTREKLSPLVSQEGLFQTKKQKVSQEGSSLHAINSSQQASFLLPQSLERVYLMNCNVSHTDYFPLTFNDQPHLVYLNLVNSPFEFLPSYNYLKRLRVLDVSGCSDLKELRRLPSTLAELYIYYCNSLNTVTFESQRFPLQEFGYEGCVNLFEVEGLFKLMPVTNLEESDLKHMTWLREYQDLKVCLVGDVELTEGRSPCVQMLYEYNIMSTSLPHIKNSYMMTDTDYMYTSQSTLLSFKVPTRPEHERLEGLIITFQYTAHGEDWVWFVKISTSSGVNLMYNPRVFGKPNEVGMWSSYWPIGKALQIEETVIVSIVVIKGNLSIHWCGASLVYTDEAANEALQENKECVAILGEDLSEFQLTTGAYYLCRRDLFQLMEAGKLTPDWFGILVDYKIDYTGMYFC